MKVFIAGVDGYLGWSLARHLAARGDEVSGADACLRRSWVQEMGSDTVVPIASMADRRAAFEERFGRPLRFFEGDLRDFSFVRNALAEAQPDAVVHLGEMPSAPYSMIDVDHCVFTHANNVIGTLNVLYAMRETCPDSHLVKLGTMGEYGTPNLDIPEGFFTVDYRGRTETLPFPKQAGSWYHWTKVHDSNNVMFACRLWGLRSTDIMQGVVFGLGADEKGDDRLNTRYDIDQSFGTTINRYCAQAVIGHPLTPYGTGQQRRSFLPLVDSMQCLTLAIDHPAAAGEYRVFNQFQEVHSIMALAEKVRQAGREVGLEVTIQPLENPRLEPESHYYNPDHQHLADLGYQPSLDLDTALRGMLTDLVPHRARIESLQSVFVPDIRWNQARRKVDVRTEP
ncbi:MAG: NAD-dependent dehydratase [Acidimicrobiaceae bacterium]|nr:NAD-dependent dehydratase [Acidimicrobiaceae bacterium]